MDEEFKALLQVIDEDVVQLCGKWKIYNQLFGSGQDNIELLNKSGSNVFSMLQILILDNVFLTLSKLTDPKKQGGHENTSISNLLKQLSCSMDDELFVKLETQLEELKTVCKNIRTHRNKSIAHSDISRVHKASTEFLPQITYGEIEDALKILREMMQDITVLLFGGSSGYDPDIAYGHGTDKLFYVLRKGHERIADEKEVSVDLSEPPIRLN